MNPAEQHANPLIAIACGGTGGHLFPGLAVARALQEADCRVMLLISPKPVDQEAVSAVNDLEIVTIPAIAMQGRDYLGFAGGFLKSLRACRARFQKDPPRAVLVMGGFTSAPPAVAGRLGGAAVFLHEANSIPGRANRLVSPLARIGFTGFAGAGARLRSKRTILTGTPVRGQFSAGDPASCRVALGLRPDKPVLLVVGGSQGASGVNKLVAEGAASLKALHPDLQYLHLTGEQDRAMVREAYQAAGCRAVVLPFLSEMELALGAATLAVSRAGASAIAEFAAMRTPAILIPFPTAADNHQFHNAKAVADTGAALLFEQKGATAAALVGRISELISSPPSLKSMAEAWTPWFYPKAAQEIAGHMLESIGLPELAAGIRARAADDSGEEGEMRSPLAGARRPMGGLQPL